MTSDLFVLVYKWTKNKHFAEDDESVAQWILDNEHNQQRVQDDEDRLFPKASIIQLTEEYARAEGYEDKIYLAETDCIASYSDDQEHFETFDEAVEWCMESLGLTRISK